MRSVAVCLLISVALFSPKPRADAALRCMIQPKAIASAFKKAAAVFVGEVTQVNDSGVLKEAHLRVEQSWKGIETREVRVLATRTAESPRYRVGERYLVFATLQNGELLTGQCSRTKRIELAQDDLAQLGKGEPPKE